MKKRLKIFQFDLIISQMPSFLTLVLLERDGGLLAKLLTPYKLGVGGKLGSGNQWLSWIHRDDLIGAIFHIISHKHIHGPVNITSPNPVTNEEFAEILSAALNRPAFVNLPNFYIKLVFGQNGHGTTIKWSKCCA